MRWLSFILVFLLAYIEISLFISVADVLGVAITLLLVILTSCLGISLVRNQGIRTLLQIQQRIASGENPAAEMVATLSLILAGILLLIPGFLTDFLGLLLLLPPVQKLLTVRLLRQANFYSSKGNTFEGEFQHRQDTWQGVSHHPDEQKEKNDAADDKQK